MNSKSNTRRSEFPFKQRLLTVDEIAQVSARTRAVRGDWCCELKNNEQ